MICWETVHQGWRNPGLYVGAADDFTDIVDFWNLRAADIDLVFYDPGYEVRLGGLKNSYLAFLCAGPEDPNDWSDRPAVWSKTHGTLDLKEIGPKLMGCTVCDATWNGLSVKPPLMFIDEKSVLASVSEDEQVPSFSFQLPEKPFFDELELHNQKVIVSMRPVSDISRSEKSTFKIPYLPELNNYYGYKAHFIPPEAHAEAGGLGIVTDITTQDVTIRALSKR